MNDPEPMGESTEDVVEQIVTSASPFEQTDADGGSDQASRDGNRAVDDENYSG